MEREIAVLMDENNQITSGTEAVRIIKYEKPDTVWQIQSSIELNEICVNSEDVDLGQVRNFYFNLIGLLGSCRILLGTSIRGILFSVFSSVDYLIIETDCFEMQMLDEIYHSAMCEDQVEERPILSEKPEPVGVNGEYYFDFLSLKRQIKTITSRQTIKPFLEQQEFRKLTILCDHKMPWLDDVLNKLDMNCVEKNTGSGIVLVIQHNL
ncbi:MAG: hypothetical protein LUI12_07070 [Clostridiales bacterium]|nr:hypothetical protein [Clostridiales bacterium]